MHVKDLLVKFNISHFIFYILVFLLFILIGLAGDGVIPTPYYSAIFFPLWLWNILLVIATVVGIIRWCKSSRNFRGESENLYQFKAMFLSVTLQFFLFLAELLISINIATGSPIPWVAVFIPFYIMCFVSIPTCIWNCYRKRSVEIEIFAMTFLLQFIFLGIKLDDFIQWSWSIVFIPFWLLFCGFVISLIIMGVVTILTYVLSENQQALESRKLSDILYFIFASIFLFFFIVFMGLLSSRLDNNIQVPYSAVLIPFHFSLFTLICLSVCRQPANIWWFGIRQNFVEFLLIKVPLLQSYANISYVKVHQEPIEEDDKEKGIKKKSDGNTQEMNVYIYEDIYMPD